MKAMILAAGLGKRLRPMTEKTPKPLIKAGGKPLLQYHIEKLVDAGITDIVINHAWLGEQIAQFVGDGSRFGCHIQCSAEAEPMETAGGIVQALPLLTEPNTIDEPFMVVNGDIWSEIDYSQLVDVDLGSDLARLVLVDNPVHNPEGDFYLSHGRVVAEWQEQSVKLTFAGVSVLSPTLFVTLKPGKRPLKPVLSQAISQGKVSGVHDLSWWCDVGTLERLQVLEQHLSQ